MREVPVRVERSVARGSSSVSHWVLVLCCVAASLATQASPGTRPASALAQPDDEAVLVEALNHVHRQRLDAALARLAGLVAKNPKFRLAQLVYADLLLAKAQPIDRFGNLPDARRDEIADLQEEARSRFDHHLSQPPKDYLPKSLLHLSPSQRRAVVVDVERSRLYLFEHRDGWVRMAADYYASTGKNGAVKLKEGDRKTPVGVYFVSGHIPDEKLPDFYGAGAFPIDYPNAWDQRQGKTGHGIWLHGVPPDTYSRPPRTSDGCVALANADFEAMAPLIEVGRTPVVIARRVEWVSPEVLAERQDGLRRAIESWRRDWESLDFERYASHYSRAFRSGERDRRAWLGHKREINARKHFIEVQIDDLSLLGHPGEAGLVVVSYDQDYRSDNFHGHLRKRQYWRLEADGVWRIVYEGSA